MGKQNKKQGKSIIRSMTGFGSARVKENGFLLRIDLFTVNNRYFKINSNFPELLSHLAGPTEKTIRNQISRGTATVTVRYEHINNANAAPFINENLLEGYIQIYRRLQEKYKLSSDLSVSELLALPGVVCSPEESESNKILESLLQKGLQNALTALLDMREKEGSALKTEMERRNQNINKILAVIENKLPTALKQFQNNLVKRASDLLKKSELQLSKNDLTREFAILAEKTDITEEIERLKSHTVQVSGLFEKGGKIGRQLDFLTQEMLREVSTMGAKTGSSILSEKVLALKVEIDRQKEQAQNIE